MAHSNANTMKVSEFIGVLQMQLNALCVGLSATNPAVEPSLMMQALAAAMGRVLSEATASPNIQFTLRMRQASIEAFSAEIKKHVPALQPLATATMQAQ